MDEEVRLDYEFMYEDLAKDKAFQRAYEELSEYLMNRYHLSKMESNFCLANWIADVLIG